MMKNLLFRRLSIVFVLVLFFSANVFARVSNGKEIVFVYDPGRTDALTGEGPDIPMMKLFEEEGYTVHKFPTFIIANANDEQIDSLNNADLVFIGRAVGSANFQSPSKEIWHSISAPVMTQNMWGLRGSRMNWFNSEAAENHNDLQGTVEGFIEIDDPVFEGLTGSVEWWTGPFSLMNTQDAGNGEILATKSDNGAVLFVRFQPFVEFYPGTSEMPSGERVYFGNASDGATDAEGNMVYNYWGFTDPIKKVFLNEVGRLTGIFPPVSVDKKFKTETSVYPNPANSSITVKMDNLSKVQILDLTGRTVSVHSASKNDLVVDVNHLNRGMYFVKAIDANGYEAVKRITKE